MRRKSLKGQLAKRLFAVSDAPQWTDTDLLLAAVNSLIHSTEQLHHKLAPLDDRVAKLEEALLWAWNNVNADSADDGNLEGVALSELETSAQRD
jgi:hypothetical protein